MMNRPYNMFAKGGLKDEGGEIDEVSGNEVPVGGTKKGVRDDIDARLSEGEFVMPEDATRYHGLKTMMQMRQEAKMGLKQMEAMGLMGNADEATLPDDIPFGLGDLMIVEVAEENGDTVEMAAGGVAFNRGGSTDQSGETISLTGGTQPVPVRGEGEVSFDDVMADAKLEFKEYRNESGASIMIPFRGGAPMFPIPAGYKLYTGEDGEPEVPDVPETGEGVIPTDDDDDQSALTAYRQSGQSTKVNWEDMSTEEFLQKANERNGFGRNLALGVASMINPIASIGMSALLRMEDEKVLGMARERMKALPAGSAQRAEYEKMIAAYEDRGKGLFGGLVSKIIDQISGLLGADEKQTKRAKNANMVGTAKNIGDYSVNGQATNAAVEAVESGTITSQFGNTLTTENFEAAQKIVRDPNASEEAKKQARSALAQHIGSELGNFVDKPIMDAVDKGINGLSPEESRQALVDIAYQPASNLKTELDGLSDTQKKFLDYDGTNYLDVIDIGREQVSAIAPRGDDLTQVTPQNITRDFTAGATTVADQQITTPTTQTQEQARQDQIAALIDAGTPPAVAAASVPMVNVPEVQAVETRNRDSLEGPEAAMAATPTVSTTAASEDVNIPVVNPAQSYATMDMGEAGRPTMPVTTTTADTPSPSVTTTPTVEEQTTQVFAPAQSYATMDMGEQGRPSTTTTGVGSGRDAADMPITADQVAYSTSGVGQSGADKYDPRTITQVPSEQVTNIPVTTTAQITAPTISTPQEPLEKPSPQNTVGDMYTTATGVTPPALPTLDSVTKPANLPTPSPDYATMDMGEAGRGTSTTEPEVTLPTSYDSQTVQDQMAALEDNYMAEAFGTETPAATEKDKPLTLADVVPDATTTTTTTTAQSFDDAFAAARAEEKKLGLAAGTSKFTYNGKEYSTALATDATAKGTSAKKEEKKGKYDPTANKSLSAGFTDNKLSETEQNAFDNAVDSGDANVANHYATINRLRNKQDAYAESGFDPAVGASLGLSAYDMEQAEKYGGSIQTAIDEGRAEKSDGFLKPAVVTDDSKSKTKTTSTSTTSTKTSSSKDSGSSGSTSTIKSGDTLSKIAKDNGTTVAEIMAANPDIKDANKIQAGASITIPKKSSGGGGSSNDNDSGGGGGGASNDDSCVIATHGISTGGFSLREKAKAEIWCERTYHGKWYGEAFRRGYRHAGTKAIERGEAQKHYQEFKDFVAYGRGLKKDWKSAVNYYKRTAQFFLTGLFVK